MSKVSVGAKTLLYPTPVLLVGTYDSADAPNIMTAAWAGICCSRPPCVAVSLREATYSHGNIVARKAFTISVPSVDLVAAADYAGIHSGREGNKFGVLGLTPVKSELVDAPYVGECPVVLECRLAHTLEIGSHTQFVGEILDVKAEAAVLGDGGLPDIERVNPLLYAPESRVYCAVGSRVANAFSVGRRETRGSTS
jgi:flavin reductase (DIM6/NTAB) family NADH-FMN oxidoreductase RutF